MTSPLFLLVVLAASIAAGVAYQRHAHAATLPTPGHPNVAPVAGAPGRWTARTPKAPMTIISMHTVPTEHIPISRVDVENPNVQRWQPDVYGAAVVFAPLMHTDIAQLVQFALAWMAIESGGNPCAVGNPYATVAPAGAPREIGLWQIYNPDDVKALGIDPMELVAYCVRPAPGEKNPQRLAAPMTAQQKARAVTIGLQFLKLKKTYADHYLTASHVQWPAGGVDHWRMIKAVHALPVLVSTGLGQVTKKLGRAPISWQEYRSTYETINPRAKYNPDLKSYGEQDGYFRALENAEWTGQQVTAQRTVT